MDIGGKRMNSVKILIVDDVETNREILGEIIKNMGCCPVLAENGVSALKMISECSPELVLSDISMPEMDGYELCRILKNDVQTRHIPIIFISAFDASKEIIKGFALGGEDYITKPFIPEVVQARVMVHLRLAEANKEIKETNRRLQVSVKEQLKQIEQEKKAVLYALANVAAEHSYYSKEFASRIQGNCRVLAQSMQFSPFFAEQISDTFIDTVEVAASLRDIGNIGIPKDILQKDTKLSGEEMEIVQSHTNIGAKLLGDLHTTNDFNDFIKTSIEIARYHHENWDGSGYPEGLKGQEIPLSAQIVAIADVFCALTEERTYRKAYSREEALEIMKEEASRKFRPEIFKIFCKVSRQLK